MSKWWVDYNWPCVCNRGDRVGHKHYQEKPYRCARCGECQEYRPDIPEHIAIQMLIGPEMSDDEAASTLLGPIALSSPSAPKGKL